MCCEIVLRGFLGLVSVTFAFTLRKVMLGFSFSLLSYEMESQPCYFNPPFLRLHIFTQEIKAVVDSGDPLEIQIACVKLLLVYRTAYKCVTKLMSFSLNEKCVQPY